MKCRACADPKPKHVPGDRVCFATRRGFELIALERRPFPLGHSLPAWFPLHKAATRAPYEGEPRAEMPLLPKPEAQFWGPRWLDIIVELWAGPIELEGKPRQAQRDATIQLVTTHFTSSMRRAIWEAVKSDGDLRAARDYLASWKVIEGPLPMLLSEIPNA